MEYCRKNNNGKNGRINGGKGRNHGERMNACKKENVRYR